MKLVSTSTKPNKPFIEYEEIELEDNYEELFKEFVNKKFSIEFGLDLETSVRIIEHMELYELLIERYWDEYYKEREKEKNNGKETD